MLFKKLTFIFVLLLLGASGLLSGCKTVYEKMELELSAEEIELYLPLSTDIDTGEESELGIEQTFTATVSNVPDTVLTDVTYQTTNDGIISVKVDKKVENETTLIVTALRAGKTDLIIKTIEGNKQETVAVSVVQRLENMTANASYNLAVAVGTPTNINTAQALNFYPINTNQKEVVYSLSSEVEGVTVSEAGLITVTQKTTNEITVLAKSVADESFTASFNVAIIQPIASEDIILTTQKKLDELAAWIEAGNLEEDFDKEITVAIMANNNENANSGKLLVEVASLESYIITATSSNGDIVEILAVEKDEQDRNAIYLKANNLGQIIITVKVQITGYPNYYALKTLTINVVNLATSININGSSATRDFVVYNSYAGLLGKELKLEVGPVSSYSKQIRLQVAEEDLEKIIIRYSDGTQIPTDQINETILPRGMSIFVSAVTVSTDPDPFVAEEANTVEINFIGNSNIGQEVEVSSTAILKLSQGATDLTVPSSLSLQKGLSSNEYPNVTFELTPSGVISEGLIVKPENANIVDAVIQSTYTYKIVAKNVGSTRVYVTTSNGIQKIMQVEVYVPLTALSLQIESPAQNYLIAERLLSATPNEYETLVSATVAVGAGIQMTAVRYPSDASIVSINYSSSNTNVASINNNGYFLTKSIGTTTISTTIVTKRFVDEDTSELVTTVKSFELTTYIPIKEISLNSMQIELYEKNSLGYFDLGKGEFQLNLAINPSNSTFNSENIVWHSSSPYLSVENGLVTASVPLDTILTNNTLTASITASIVEYGRYYAKTCLVTIKRAIKVDSITVYNVPEGYVYFDARNGLSASGTKQLSIQTYPYTVTNSNVRYVYVKDNSDTNETPVFTVSETGLITPVRAGIALLHVVAEDSFSSQTEYSRYNEIVVKVADGLTENTALEIKTASELMAIDTIYELGLHYILANNLDFTNKNFTPLGLIGGTAYEFTGSLNGKFTYGNITRQYKIKGLTLTSNAQNINSYLGLFAVNGGTLKNLKIEVSSFTVNAVNNSLGSVSYFATLCAINNGIIENVVVNVLTSNIFVAARQGFVGILTAQNYGTILNSTVYGDLTVKEASGLSVTPQVIVGGLSAVNMVDAQILGSFSPANKQINPEEVMEPDYSNVLYQKEGMNSFAIIDTSLLTSSTNASGLAVGVNYGTVSNIASDGKITAKNNVGGLIGINISLVQNSYSASQVIGESNVGGLIGYATSETVGVNLITPVIVNNAVEIYDRVSTYEMGNIAVQGVNNVGGLIGLADALDALAYNYVNSYSLRVIGENYIGDIVLNYLDETANFTVGGLIGKLTNVTASLQKNYTSVTINTVSPVTTNNTPTIYAGGLIGYISGDFTITNSYTKGTIELPVTNSVAGTLVGHVENVTTSGILDYIYSTTIVNASVTSDKFGDVETLSQAFISVTFDDIEWNILESDFTPWDIDNSLVWYVDSEMNGGLPILYNSQNNLLINEAPETVAVSVKEQQIFVNPSDNSISFHHLKVDNKKAVVLLQEDTYAIRDIINTLPLNSRYYLSTENTDIIEILENGNIRVLKEGTATIRVSSLLNTNIFDTFELAVINGFTKFSLSASQDKTTGELNEQDVLQIKLNESILLYSELINGFNSVSSKTGIIYSATASNFTVNGQALNATIGNVATHILTAGSVASDGNIEVTVTPYFKVTLSGEEVIIPVTELSKTFYVSVYEGASSITTGVASATIGLREELQLDVYVTTDKPDEIITVLGGIVEDTESDSILDYIEADFIGSELIAGTTDEYIFSYIIKAQENFLEVNSGSGNFKSAKSGTITFTPNSNLELATTFNITITPEDLLRIDMAHYPTGETQIVDGKANYYPQELPSNIIAPGQPGILKVNLFPEYANVDYYEIVSSVVNSREFISFEQVALVSNEIEGVIDNIYYAPVSPSPAGILYGTTLNLISTANRSNNTIEYKFDGNIYVKTLISSGVVKGTVFTVTITGYRIDEEGNPQVNLTKSINLTVDALPGITLLYNGAKTGYVARGTTVPLELYLSDDYNGILKDPIASLNANGNKDYDSEGNDITITNKIVSYVNVEKINDTYYLDIGPAVPSGSTITVTASVERTLNGILEVSQSTITLQVASFVIKSVNVEQVNSTSSNTMNLYVGQSMNLRVNLVAQKLNAINIADYQILLNETEYNNLVTISQNITSELDKIENTLSRNMKSWYERVGTQTAYVDNSLEENNYNNFTIYKFIDAETTYDYSGQSDIYLSAKKVSTSSNLVAKVEYYYDETGRVQAVILDGNDYVQYPEIYKTDEETGLPLEHTVPADAVVLYQEFAFNLNIVSNSTEDKPIPIYNEEDLLSMQAGVDYILLNDKDTPLVLENWTPLNVAIKSLDGNERIIQIKSFAASANNGTYNFGLFGIVNSSTVLKNLKIDISALVENSGIINATEFSTVNFGFIAGINNGTITNADIINSSSTNNAVTINTAQASTTTIGALVGYNSGGYITNSRVGRMDIINDVEYYAISLKANGNIAGFAGYNNGVITSSYVANLTLENLSESLNNNKTGGFVAINASGARISYSFVEGIQSSITNNVINEGGITAVGTIGGFVHENNGEITDSYSNTPIITQSRSAGFVYQNNEFGIIKNAYSASKIIESTTANLPFIGSSSLEELLYKGTLTNTYYLANPNYFTSQFGGEYPAISVTNFDQKTSFSGFGFLNEPEYTKFGAWEISASSPRPILPSALDITKSERKISYTTITGGVITEYGYTDAEGTDIKGTGNNPILVATAKQFLEAMTWQPYLDNENKNDNKIRLIRDIDFSEIVNNSELAKLQTVTFTGILDGNGMTLKNVRVLSSVSVGVMQQSFGMLYKIGLDDEDYLLATSQTVIKNLNITVSEISATDSISVGVLTGEISNSIIMNVTLSGQNITVQGRNLVGGLAGRITGDSRIINVTSNLSVSSEYRSTGEYYYYNEYDAGTLNNLVSLENFSYAGGIAGVVDLYIFDEFGVKQTEVKDWSVEKPKINTLVVNGNVKIRGEKAGGVIGYIGPFTYLKNALFEVNYIQDTNYQSIVGLEIAGGIIAENNGLVDHIRIEHKEEYQLNTIDKTEARRIIGYQGLFKESALYVGGLVGYNNMGKIANSYSRIDVVNASAQVGGGLIGINYGGSLNKVYATGHILAGNVIGGLIGTLSNTSLQDVDASGVSSGEVLEIADAFAVNNWQLSAFQNVGPAYNGTYDLGETFTDTNSNGVYDTGETFTDSNYAFRELVNGVYRINTSKYIGAFIGEQKALSQISSTNSWYINEVFSVLGAVTNPETQIKYLKEVGNNSNNLAGVNVIVKDEETTDTQFEAITKLYADSTAQKYANFTESLLWTIDSVRFPKLLFSDFEDIIAIYDEDDLITALTNQKYATLIIKNDIYLSKEWTPTLFKGTLIGEENAGAFPTIYNLNINNASQDIGLFSNLESATIANFNIVVGGQENVVWTGNYSNGIIATGTADDSTASILAGNVNNSSIKNIKIYFASSDTSLESSANYTGFIIGRAKNVTISNVLLKSLAGNFVVDATVIEPDLAGDGEYELMYVGGAFGKFEIGMIDSITVQDINLTVNSANELYVGGLSGMLDNTDTTVVDTFVNLNVATDADSNSYIGGVVGEMQNGDLSFITSNGAVNAGVANVLYAGGIAGKLTNVALTNISYKNTLDNSFSAVEISNMSYLGGLVGYAKNTYFNITNATINMNVINQSSANYIGGLVGYLYNEENYGVNLSYSKANIAVNTRSTLYVGGLIGSNKESNLYAEIHECYTQGKINAISSSAIYAGGLVGYNQSIIRKTFSTMDVSVVTNSTQMVGGLIGRNSADIYDSYVYGTIYSNKNIAADTYGFTVNPVIGKNYSAISTRVYYDKDMSGLTARTSATGGINTDTLISVTTFSDASVWTKEDGSYPYLKNVDAPNLNFGGSMRPIPINTAEQLSFISNTDKFYIQRANITYDVATYGVIATFLGAYNGNGYTITYNQTGSENINNFGLFATIKDGAIISGVAINANLTLTSNSSITNNLGGLATVNQGIIFKSYAKVTINNGAAVNLLDGKIGGLVSTNNSLIENSFAVVDFDFNYYGTSTNPLYLGGLVGYSVASGALNSNPAINTSFATGEIKAFKQLLTGTLIVGGIAAVLNDTTLSNSYTLTIMDIIFGTSVGGIFGAVNSSTVNNTYYDIFATDFNNTYGKATSYMTSSSFVDDLEVTNRFDGIWTLDKTINYGYPYPSYLSSTYINNILKTGNGTYTDPYLINHAGRLDWIRTQLSNAVYFKQTRNINLELYNSINTQFEPIGNTVLGSATRYGTTGFTNFIGIYDGQNYTINNLIQTFSGTASIYTGLFAKLQGGQSIYTYGYVYNVFLTNVDISISASADMLNAYVGGIAGYATSSKIINSKVIGNISDYRDKSSNVDKRLFIGGITGYSYNTIINACYNNADITASFGYIGGMVGYINGGELTNSYNSGNITVVSKNSTTDSRYFVGGITSNSSNSKLFNLKNNGSITVQAIKLEALGGSQSGEYTISSDSGNNGGTGGIVGYVEGGSLTHASNSGIITFIGYSNNNNNMIAGVAGYVKNVPTLQTLSNTGNMDITYGAYGNYVNIVGGVIGYAYSDVDKRISYISNTGTIYAQEALSLVKTLHLGGLIGSTQNDAANNGYSLSYSFNSGNINATSALDLVLGGIIGYSNKGIISCYNNGNITATVNKFIDTNLNKTVDIYVGGITGYNMTNSVEKSYNTGNITLSRDANTSTTYVLNIGGISGGSYENTNFSIKQAYNEGILTGNISFDVSNQTLNIGGIIGKAGQDIYNSYNIGQINGNFIRENVANMGGIVGLGIADIVINRTYNTGTINNINDVDPAGGRGYTYYRGQIIGKRNIIMTISNQRYYNQQVIDSMPGPYGGQYTFYMGSYGYVFDPNEVSLYENSQHIGVNDSTTNGYSLSSMKQQATYTNWDFTNTWTINEGVSTPTLQDMPSNIDIKDGSISEPTIVLPTALMLPAQSVPNVALS